MRNHSSSPFTLDSEKQEHLPGSHSGPGSCGDLNLGLLAALCLDFLLLALDLTPNLGPSIFQVWAQLNFKNWDSRHLTDLKWSL